MDPGSPSLSASLRGRAGPSLCLPGDPTLPFMPHLPHGQDQQHKQHQAAKHAYQHPPDGNVPLLQGAEQVRLHLRADPRGFSVTLHLPLRKTQTCGLRTPKQATYLCHLSDLGVPHPHPVGADTWEDSGSCRLHTHPSFPTGQAEGRHSIGKGGDVEPSLRLQHELIQWPLNGVG